jgi:hypothetical protein
VLSAGSSDRTGLRIFGRRGLGRLRGPDGHCYIIGRDFTVLALDLVLDVVRSCITSVGRIEDHLGRRFQGRASGNLVGGEFGLSHRQKAGLIPNVAGAFPFPSVILRISSARLRHC